MSTLWSIVIAGTAYSFTSQGVYLRAWQGAGVPPVRNLVSEYGLRPGAFYERTQIQARTITLEGRVMGSSLSNLHAVRSTLLRRLTPGTLVTLRYTGASTTVEIDGYYEGGLELGELSGFSDRLLLRFVCPHPFFRGTSQEDADLTTSQTLSTANRVAQRTSGVWSNMAAGVNNAVRRLRYNTTGALYAAGQFTGGIARWNGSTWSVPGGGANGSVDGIAFDANANVWISGAFTAVGTGDDAITANRIAYWDGGDWATLGSGIADGVAYAIEIGIDGLPVVGGTFTGYAKRWTGSTWAALGSGVSDNVYFLLRGPDSNMYACGSFITAGGVTVNRVAKWDGSAWSALGSGINDTGYSMAFGTDGRLYVCGDFTTAGGVTANHVAVWDGTRWSALGSGLNGQARTIFVDDDGRVYVGGSFTTAGGIPLPDRMAVWNGSTWFPLDIDLPGSAQVFAFIQGDFPCDLLVGFNTAGPASVAGRTTVTNPGSADASPSILFWGTGRIYSLINWTTGREIYFDISLQDGEYATLDLEAKTFISDWRGNVLSAVRPGSNMATWSLAPGANVIAVNADTTIEASILYTPQYLSVDG